MKKTTKKTYEPSITEIELAEDFTYEMLHASVMKAGFGEKAPESRELTPEIIATQSADEEKAEKADQMMARCSGVDL